MPSAFYVIVSRVWDLYVTNSILTGWLLSKINTYHSSLFCAWVIFMCDLVYIMDDLARTSKKSQSFSSWTSFVVAGISAGTILTNFCTVAKFVTFVPYHVLVLVELDISGVYLLVCALRVARLLQSGRLYVHVAWTLTSLAKNGGLLAKSVYYAKNRPSRKTQKAMNEDDYLKRAEENSPFLNYVQKLIVKEIKAES